MWPPPGAVEPAPLPAPMDEARFWQGLPFFQWVRSSGDAGRWERRYQQANPPPACVGAFRAFASRGGRLYALAETWCGDCAQVMPAVARLCDESGVPLRVFARDSHPDLRDGHLTGGRPKIPLIVAVLPDGRHGTRLVEVGRFVERPALANERRRRGDPFAYASHAVAEALWMELQAMVEADGERCEVAGPSGTLPVSMHLPWGFAPGCAVVTAHGDGDDRQHPLSRHLCQRLAQRGVAAVRFDFAFRVRGGQPSDDGAAELADLQAVAAEVSRRLGLPPDRLVLAGRSVGAVAAARLAGLQPCAGLIAFGLPPSRSGEPDETAPALLAGLPVPLLAFAGRRDGLADPARVEQAFAQAAAAELVWLQDDPSRPSSLQPVLDRAVAWVLQQAAAVAPSAAR